MMALWFLWYLLAALMPELESTDFSPNILKRTGLREDPEIHMNVTQLITSKGYPCEEYDVHTKDGYILGVQRIPGGRAGHREFQGLVGKPAVLLQHPLLSCSSCWVENLANDSLGFMLADAGFDVWLGNNRGNSYSKRHEHLTPDQKEFWNFSFDEMAKYDLPAMVDKIISITGANQIFYVGHSQGGGIGIAQLSQDPDFASKIKLYVGLAPGVYVGDIKSPVRLLLPFVNEIQVLEELLGGHGEFMPESNVMKWLANNVCASGEIPLFLCENILFIIAGYDFEQMNASRIPVYVAQHPAGTSVMNIIHFAQLMKSKQFQMFDYGPEGNMKKYNQTTPPLYYPSNITTPVVLYSGTNDWLITPVEMQRLVPQIKSLVKHVVINGWEHLDFIWAMDAPKECYNEIIRLFKGFT